jgi:tetratricopeptide (TPR) repeat protein
MNRLRWLTFLAVSLLSVGCCSVERAPARTLTGDPLLDGPAQIQHGRPQDRVLWQYRLAAAAMQRGQFAEAKAALDDAIARLGGINVADKDARKARGYFHEEARKTFLGEPYERVMAYYYRGLLYWMDGEPDNARACFRSAQIQDGDAENKTYAADYVLLDYLDGLVTAKLGGDGSDAFQRARAACKLAIPSAANPRANALFFVEFGDGPRKIATGQYGEELRFRGGGSRAREAMIKVSGQAAHVGPYDDLYYQATTRGGRVMDHILGNKAVFKAATDVAGDVALFSGLVLAQDRDTRDIGLGLAAAGLLSKIFSASTRPEADTRTWHNLPLFLSFAALELPPGPHTATVEFLDEGRRPIPALTKTVSFTVPAGGPDKVIFVSDKSTTPQTL